MINSRREPTNPANELTEGDLTHVSGGKPSAAPKGGNAPAEYLKVEMKEVFITSVQL